MKRILSGILLVSLCLSDKGFSQYKVGDQAMDFSLKNIDGKMVSLKDYKDAKGFIVTFTCNHCPYAKAYERRIMDLDKKFAALGYPVIAISPNDPIAEPEDSFDNMVKRAKEKNYTFPYLMDETQSVTKTYGAKATPHIFLLKKNGKDLEVVYIGAIDDNTENAGAAKNKYVEAALDALSKGQKPAISSTKAIGCSIKWKKS